ncbi:hypothetical protein SMICM304S_03309 [Streptomyces microflavus]
MHVEAVLAGGLGGEGEGGAGQQLLRLGRSGVVGPAYDCEVRRERQLLEAHHPRPLGGGEPDALPERGAVLGGIAVPPLLYGCDAQGGALGGAGRVGEAGGLYAVIRRMTSSRGEGPAGRARRVPERSGTQRI